MADHAAHVMQAVILAFEDPVHPADVKEQALCILANDADGDRARDHIMANEDVLKKLMDYMMQSNVKLQVAAIFCVCNLVWREEAGAAQRQARLKELSLYRISLQLRRTKDTQLFDKYVDYF
ncbi:armadillo repeat-containing protein 8 [Nasonia vitripennis]|uniref:Armadillo repeat-containing protein 8 n=1 Tax=Nasonia vitripennis TaxID=7425 RepID=A0A7M7R289_NASVI|nr:armadillo repeat-containing protein 8 [Nasonia vitripennis]XP_031778250.1 armadillo repeat-containing protein 8 [Nasonia vitripennis]XP_031778251.1 armadillo repeat-containing protein 8 [Nasonia vitripennis]XP_032457344.1 armadillo repeat-containing protein 8 [Nasonia vitripennis]